MRTPPGGRRNLKERKQVEVDSSVYEAMLVVLIVLVGSVVMVVWLKRKNRKKRG